MNLPQRMMPVLVCFLRQTTHLRMTTTASPTTSTMKQSKPTPARSRRTMPSVRWSVCFYFFVFSSGGPFPLILLAVVSFFRCSFQSPSDAVTVEIVLATAQRISVTMAPEQTMRDVRLFVESFTKDSNFRLVFYDSREGCEDGQELGGFGQYILLHHVLFI
eukprot:m.852509 g.852509  ORF g.852509 m.852509 type:complete len:161 (+) comp59600_c0_seq4:3150-3632(+)